jgi:hypothetical protein
MKRRSFLQALLGASVAAATGVTIAAEPAKAAPFHTDSDIKGWAELTSALDEIKESIVSGDRRSRGLLVIESNGVHHVLPLNTGHLFK